MIRNFLLIIFISLFFPISSWAAILYLEPAEGEYHQEDVFMVEVRIDTEEECINTVQADLGFSKDILEAVDFSQGNSILTVWVETPKIDQDSGTVSFTGGIPGGYCGILPGDPGQSNLLGKMIFNAKEVDFTRNTEVKFLDTSQILLNDGLGTPAELKTKKAIFTILPGVPEVPKREWQKELEKDKVPPEPFEIEVNQDPSVSEGKYFITFQTTDKQSGIDHYEVKEGKKNWREAASPYTLEDQEIKGILKVKAVDKAGNERIAEYIPETPKKPFPYWIIILILAGIIIWLLWQKRQKSF